MSIDLTGFFRAAWSNNSECPSHTCFTMSGTSMFCSQYYTGLPMKFCAYCAQEESLVRQVCSSMEQARLSLPLELIGSRKSIANVSHSTQKTAKDVWVNLRIHALMRKKTRNSTTTGGACNLLSCRPCAWMAFIAHQQQVHSGIHLQLLAQALEALHGFTSITRCQPENATAHPPPPPPRFGDMAKHLS